MRSWEAHQGHTAGHHQPNSDLFLGLLPADLRQEGEPARDRLGS